MNNKNQVLEKSNVLTKIVDNKVIASSRTVADIFGKEHAHVLRDIRNILVKLEEYGVYETFGDTPLFTESTWLNEQNGQYYPEYLMSRDGFTLLAMGFTGIKALEWKLKYIRAFNEMEKRLRSPGITDHRLEIARLIIQAPESRVNSIRELYPEYFSIRPEADSLEYVVDLNTTFTRWIQDYNVTKEWIEDFPTTEVYNNYVRYCMENHLASMGKKLFYHVLERDFNLTKKQKGDGHRYFIPA